MFNKLSRAWFKAVGKAGKKVAAIQARQRRQVVKAFVASSKGATRPPSSGPAKRATHVEASWSVGHVTVPSSPLSRIRYRLCLPTQRPATGMPLLVMLHGCQQDADDFATGTRMHLQALRQGYAVLYPEQSLRANAHRCWRWYEQSTQQGGGDTAVLMAMIEKVRAMHAIDARRIYACGISAGAAMAHILALSRPGLFAAVALHAGPVMGGCRNAVGAYGVMQHGSSRPLVPIEKWLARHPAAPPLPALLVAGEADEVVRPVNLGQLAEQFIRINAAAAMKATAPRRQVFGRASRAWPHKRSMRIQDFKAGRSVLVRTVSIEGLGHAWSGGDTRLRFNEKGPDASRMTLAFFAGKRGIG